MTDKPSINCPAELRKRFAAEIDLIRRTTRTAPIRSAAIDHAIKKFKDANPQYFRQDPANVEFSGDAPLFGAASAGTQGYTSGEDNGN